jgi:hypothetical protein
MATQLYTPGPTYLQVGLGASAALLHLGWTERGVRITFDGAFEDVITDVSGTRIPFDVLDEAEQAFVTADLVLYDEAVLNTVNARRGFIAGASSPDTEGTIATTAVGSLMRFEGFMYRLLVFCPYSQKTAYNTGTGMRPGYNFLSAYLDAAREIELSSRVKIQRCIFRAIPNWSQTAGGGTLFNFTVSDRVSPT